MIDCTEKNATSTGDRATRQISEAHAAVVAITIELKQLEMLAAEIEESASRLSTVAAEGVYDADDALTSLDAAQRNDQVTSLYSL